MSAFRIPAASRTIRTIGFDDGPFQKRRGATVPLVGIVCAGTRFEGMVYGALRKDGWRANEVVARLLGESKYATQVHAVLLDGIAFGGLDVVDLPALVAAVRKPCIAVMRRPPDVPAMRRAIEMLPRAAERLRRLDAAGKIHTRAPFTFQTCGLDVDAAEDVLRRVTDRGHVPEPLRLAHLVGSAIKDGESRGRA